MSVGETQAFGGEPIERRRGNFGIRIVTFEISVTEIVGEDDDDVGFVGSQACGGAQNEQSGGPGGKTKQQGNDSFHSPHEQYSAARAAKRKMQVPSCF